MVILCKCGHTAKQHGQGNAIIGGKKYPCQECSCEHYDREFLPFPGACPDCGAAWEKMGDIAWTLVGYLQRDQSHHHDDNCMHRTVVCAGGHGFKLGLRRVCKNPDCDWQGQATCWCESFAKVDKWPDLKYEERLW